MSLTWNSSLDLEDDVLSSPVEVEEDRETREGLYPVHPLCRSCRKECKVHDAPGLLQFVCYDYEPNFVEPGNFT